MLLIEVDCDNTAGIHIKLVILRAVYNYICAVVYIFYLTLILNSNRSGSVEGRYRTGINCGSCNNTGHRVGGFIYADNTCSV